MIRFRSLGSGSSGNATLVEATGLLPFRLLIDCGLGFNILLHRLARAGLAPGDIHAVFITHEHSDHIGCAHDLSLRYRIPIWMSRGTYVALGSPDFDGLLRRARDGDRIDLGGIEIMPFTVPHDAREPLQVCCSDGASKLGLATDFGQSTPHVLMHLAGCDTLLLESNHDIDLLEASSYPWFLKRRISGDYGHLSNTAAAQIAKAVSHARLKRVVAAHLSEENNRPDLPRRHLAAALGCDEGDIMIADALHGTPWVHL